MTDPAPSRLVFIDEAGSTISMTRRYGRAPRGQRAEDTIPRNRGTVTSMVGALTVDGLVAMACFEGGTDGDRFMAFLEQVLGPELVPGDLVIMDNAGAHKDARIRPFLESLGAKPVYLPPYSPELNPIELAWSKLKTWLRTAKARTTQALDAAIAKGMHLITPEDAEAWIRHCGYCGQEK
jgi:transposase